MNISNNFKMVIVLDESLSLGLLANTSAVLSLSLGEKIKGLIGKDLLDKSGVTHIGLTQIPLPILKASKEQILKIYQASLGDKELLMIDITDSAQTTKNYNDYEDKLKEKTSSEHIFLGLALAGSIKTINKLTGSLPLLR
jgi:hypothetical protein